MGKMMQEEHLKLQLRKATRGTLMGCLVFALFALSAALEEAKGRLADRRYTIFSRTVPRTPTSKIISL